MALYKQSDMIYKDYSWTATKGDDPKVSGPPDSTLLNRHEGYEVLYLINRLATDWSFKNVESGKKIEKMIREHLPSNIRSQENVKTWISDNWQKH